MQSNVLLLLPARLRQVAYILFGLIALAVGAAQVAYSSISLDNPTWLVVSSAVVGFLAIPFSAIAASNVSKDRPARVIEPEIGEEERNG
jgi:hypothetical protein